MVQIHPPLPFLLTKRFTPQLRKIFEHTADAGIEVKGKNLSEAFDEVSLAFTEIITPESPNSLGGIGDYCKSNWS